MYCLDKERSPRYINCKKQVANTLQNKTACFYMCPSMYIITQKKILEKKKKDKTFEKHDPKWQQSLGSMRLGGRDGLLTTYTSVV